MVHDNTAHVHSHIVFNSVSFVDGKKYRYEKGDWAKYIQPITNKLCQEYGLSIIDVDDGSKEKSMKAIRTGANIVKAVCVGRYDQERLGFLHSAGWKL